MGKVEIIDLNNMNVSNVAKRLPKSKPIFVAFLADWCGHCHHMQPEWESFVEKIKAFDVPRTVAPLSIATGFVSALPRKSQL